MALIAKVKLDVLIPSGVTKAEAKEWLRFQLGDNGGMSADNPLVDEELEPYYFEVEFYDD
jgi:hypothetical protein